VFLFFPCLFFHFLFIVYLVYDFIMNILMYLKFSIMYLKSIIAIISAIIFDRKDRYVMLSATC